MRVLVTGGAGYIGSHACKALAQAGYTPVAYDNLGYGHRDAVRWGPLEVGDIADRERLDAVIAHYRPEAVLHFAAYAYVGESVTDPAKYYRNNVAGTLTLLEALLHHGIGRIVFSSTCATYGVPERTPIDEDHPQHPINPYGASKLMIERMLRDFDAAYGLRSVSLRYFNAAGADPDGEIGEDHDPETHLIPLALQAALGQRAALQVFGTDYPTPDGSCIRDYIHVTDLAQAHVRALDYLASGGATTALNLGTGHGHSVLEVIEAARSVSARDVPVVLTERRPGDPPVLTAAADKARSLLGWQPRHTDLAEILRHAWNWHRKQPHPPPAGWAKRGVSNKTMTDDRQDSITVYTPGSALRQPSVLLADLFRDIWRGRGLAWRLAVRDISAQYRQAALGLMWALILPLANTAVWIFLNGSGIVRVGETPLPYAVYVFTGTMLWAIFMDAMNAPLQQATAAKAMLAKINFPREALVISGILQTLFNGGIKIALLLVVLLFFGIYPSWTLLLFPLAIVSLILAGTAFGLLLTPIGLLYTDIGKGLPLVLQFLMYVTPVVFPMPTGGWALTIFTWNPLTPLILTARDWLTGFPADVLGPFLLVNAIVLVLLLFMGIVFRLAMPMLIERMGS